MSEFKLDYANIDSVTEAIMNYGEGAESAINRTLEEFAAPLVEENITRILPVSGRVWKGKKRAAKFAKPFVRQMVNLGFIIRTKSAYNYLYFPDDGSSTRKHVGNKQFMIKGTEMSVNSIIDRCIADLVKDF